MNKVQKLPRLPRAYSSFAALFGRMDTPMMAVIGGILGALSDRLDMIGAFQNQSEGDFVGYDGLENRGKLANLLETEWLLRELDADDFVRRIAEGEVLFRRREFQNSGKRNTLAVILDCGPWMLGRNRLVGLAALFYLALRAERTGAEISWIVPGSTAETKPNWVSGLSRETINRYLGQIVQTRLNATDIDAALAGLEVQGRLDCWYVGSHQTAEITEHPDIGSAFLVRTRYGGQTTASAEIKVTSRRRQLANIDVTFEDDSTCVAALRRPFKPVARPKNSHRLAPVNSDVLSALPFNTGWLLDRHNQAVLIRLPEGILWQPLKPGAEQQGVWLPIHKKDFLLGVQVEQDRSLVAMIACSRVGGERVGVQPYEVSLIRVGLDNDDNAVFAGGLVELDPSLFPNDALGNFHLQPHCAIVGSDGLRRQFYITPERGLRETTTAIARVLFVDANYRTEIHENPGTHIRVKNIARDLQMLRETLAEPAKDLFQKPRRVLFSPSAKVLAITFDDRFYTIYGAGDPTEVELPEGLVLLHIENQHKGMAWNAEESKLVQLTFRADTVKQKLLKMYQWAILGLPRYCPLTGTVFAIRTDGDGQPLHFVPIHTKRGWQDVRALDLPEAIEKARTIWLES